MWFCILGAAVQSGCIVEKKDPLRLPDRPASELRRNIDLPVEAPQEISLGSVRAGQKRRRSFIIINRSGSSKAIERVESSCPCVEINPHRFTLETNSSAMLEVTCNTSEEPRFQGRLCVEIVGYGPEEAEYFRTNIIIDIDGDVR
jgi:hypothetical protein